MNMFPKELGIFKTRVDKACLEIEEIGDNLPLWEKMVKLWLCIYRGRLNKFGCEFKNDYSDSSDSFNNIQDISGQLDIILIFISLNYEEILVSENFGLKPEYKIIKNNEEFIDLIKKGIVDLSKHTKIFENSLDLSKKKVLKLEVTKHIEIIESEYEETKKDIYFLQKLVNKEIIEG